jgi:hypothetical protein
VTGVVQGHFSTRVHLPAIPSLARSEMPVETLFAGQVSRTGDSSIFKISPVTAARRLEFRAEFFNAFNHLNPEFANPNTISENVATENGSPGFGFAPAARDPRFIQFALKFYF